MYNPMHLLSPISFAFVAIFLAAYLVNVIIRIRFGSTPAFTKFTALLIRTVVFPLPATATIRRQPFSVVAASCCFSFNFIDIWIPPDYLSYVLNMRKPKTKENKIKRAT